MYFVQLFLEVFINMGNSKLTLIVCIMVNFIFLNHGRDKAGQSFYSRAVLQCSVENMYLLQKIMWKLYNEGIEILSLNFRTLKILPSIHIIHFNW